MAISRFTSERKTLRFSLDVRAKLRVDGQEFTVRTLDVSEGGVGIMSPVEIPEGNSYEIELTFCCVQGVFRGKLARRNRSGFRYGFAFVDLNSSSIELMRKFQRRWNIQSDK